MDGGGTDGSLKRAGGLGAAVGPADEKDIIVGGAPGGVGLRLVPSDPTIGPDDEKGVIVGGAEAKGVEEGLMGKFGRPGFSVPMFFNNMTMANT